MEKSCHKCGAQVKADSAFCPKCGAVVGMSDAGGSSRGGGEWDMASTLVGKKGPRTPPPTRPPAPPPSQPTAADARGAAQSSAPARSNTMLIAAVGFAAVLIIGGLLLFLLYMNSQG